VFVEGQPEVRSFQRNDGTAGASLSMRVREVQLLGRKGENGGGSDMPMQQAASGGRQGAAAPASIDEAADDLPF
jgi:single-strand DNA-binding protein